MGEIWKDIKGFEGMYQVSNFGRVRSFKSKECMLLKLSPNKGGYLTSYLSKRKSNVRHFAKMVHRLVAEHFIDNPNNLPCVNHIDGNKTNNHINNLEWTTYSYNTKHAYSIGKAHKSGYKWKKIKIQNIETGESFESMHDCMRYYGIRSSRQLYDAIRNPSHTAKGYHFKKYE